MSNGKLKSSRGAAKRFKKTAGGWRCKQSHLRHILTKKSAKRKRHLRSTTLVHPSDVASINQLLPHA